ncbi:MAG: hypothetical protein QG622_1652 [Actinomycetota bacterium]|nr:hypothetical protein [Actinomycetota bacterium]
MRFGQLLLGHRTRALLSQEDLARLSGLSARSIRDLESGRVTRPRAASVRQLVESLHLTGDERAVFESAALSADRGPASGAGATSVPQAPAPVHDTSASASANALADAASCALADRLARSLLSRWREEINNREIGVSGIDVTWRVTPRTPDEQAWRPVRDGVGPAALPEVDVHRARGRRDGTVADLYDLYAAVPSGRFVVRAGAGGGKTSALLLLAARSLHLRQQLPQGRRHRLPVAVPLSLAEWDPSRTGLVEFAADTLSRDLPWLRGPRTADDLLVDLIDSGGVALFLDGLDEMAVGAPEAVARINAASHVRVVLASRPEEYARATDTVPLAGALVVDLLPVDVPTALDFMRGRDVADGPWEEVLTRLTALGTTGGPLLATPLYLSLLARCYHRRSPAELLDESRFPTADAVAARLISSIIPQSYPPGRPGPTSAQAQKWLAFLARRMTHGADGRPLSRPRTELAWSQVAEWLPRWPARLVDGIGMTIVVALTCRTALNGVLASQSPIGDRTAAVPALWGVVGALAYLVIVELDRRLTGVNMVGLSVGSVGGTVLGMLGGVVLATRLTMVSPTAAVACGLSGGVVLAAVISLSVVLMAMRTPRQLSRRQWPSSLGRGAPSWRTALLLGIPCGFYLLARPHVTGTDLAVVTVTLLATACCEAMLSAQGAHRGPATARQSVRRDLAAWSTLGVVLGGGGGLLLCTVFGTGLAGLPGWFAAGLLLSLLSSHSVAYLLAVAWFRFRRQLPLAPLRFLDDAWRRGVLRRNGWRYEFRHKLLLDALGDAGPGATGPGASGSGS